MYRGIPQARAPLPGNRRGHRYYQHHQNRNRMTDYPAPEDPSPERRAAAQAMSDCQKQRRHDEQPQQQSQIFQAHERALGKSHNQ